MPVTDEQIASKVQGGDKESFGLLLERYEDKIVRYARKFFSNDQDIEDLVQESFIKAYSNINSFDASRKFSPWLYRIAHNEFVNLLKKRSKSSFFSLDVDALFPHPVAKETADGELNAWDLKQALNQTLDKLDVKYREPLVLFYLQELSYQEISDVLELPISTVGVRIQRGRGQLKILYEEKYGRHE